MLSICVPIYNQSISFLLNDLSIQINDIKEEVEIIFIDDASTNKVIKKQNKSIQEKFHRYIILEQNIGRAKIRNLFLKYVNYNYLLFIDGDSKIISKDYLKKTIDVIKSEKDLNIISFSSIYQSEIPKHQYRLRWYYGKKIETSVLKSQNKSFMTNNFLIEKNLFKRICFNESITEYGHEDTLFGYDLLKAGIEIKNIYNPVLNAELDTNKNFIHKSEISLNTLLKIKGILNDEKFNKSVRILDTYDKIKKNKIVFVLISSPFINYFFRSLLQKTILIYPKNINLLNAYKLLYLTKISKNQ